MFNKHQCSQCGKIVNFLYKKSSLVSLTDGFCEECVEKNNKKDLELLDAIREGKNLSKFI